MRSDRPDPYRDDVTVHHRRSGWIMPLFLLAALAVGGLIYAVGFDDDRTASTMNGTSTSAPATTGSGTGRTGAETGAAVTQTPGGAATGGGGAASR
jgi:hypothetical protein